MIVARGLKMVDRACLLCRPDEVTYNAKKLAEARRAGAVESGDEETMANQELVVRLERLLRLLETKFGGERAEDDLSDIGEEIAEGKPAEIVGTIGESVSGIGREIGAAAGGAQGGPAGASVGAEIGAAPGEAISGVGRVLSEATRPAEDYCSPALADLRRLRPIIVASGDRKAIDAYNNTIRAVKRQTANLVSALDARPGRKFFLRDSRYDGPHAGEAEDFEASAARLHRKDIRLRPAKESAEKDGPVRRAEDSEESFLDMAKRRGEELRKKKY